MNYEKFSGNFCNCLYLSGGFLHTADMSYLYKRDEGYSAGRTGKCRERQKRLDFDINVLNID